MDKIQLLKEELKEQLALANMEGVINRLRRLSKRDSRLERDVVLASGRFITMKEDRYKGIASSDDLSLENNRIREAMLDLIYKIDAPDIQWEKPDALLLVVSREQNPEDQTYLAQFFSVSHRENWKVDYALGEPENLNYDLIIFDNFRANTKNASENDKDHLFLLKKLLKISVAPLLYCGVYNSDLEPFRDRVNAANSPFTLLPRIRESLEFISVYKGMAQAPWNQSNS